MQLGPKQTLELVDSQKRRLGRMTLENSSEGLLEGTFTAGPDYPAVGPLFRALEEAADLQALSAVDRLDAQIAALGLHLLSSDGAVQLPAHDVQIWADGAMTCRVSQPSLPRNGSYAANQPSPETHKEVGSG